RGGGGRAGDGEGQGEVVAEAGAVGVAVEPVAGQVGDRVADGEHVVAVAQRAGEGHQRPVLVGGRVQAEGDGAGGDEAADVGPVAGQPPVAGGGDAGGAVLGDGDLD